MERPTKVVWGSVDEAFSEKGEGNSPEARKENDVEYGEDRRTNCTLGVAQLLYSRAAFQSLSIPASYSSSSSAVPYVPASYLRCLSRYRTCLSRSPVSLVRVARRDNTEYYIVPDYILPSF